MDLDVILLPAGLPNLTSRAAVVIDVLRATTTIVAALHEGCPEVLPVELPEEAIDLAKKFGRDSHLVGGERKGLKVEGFDLGNSPGEYNAAVLAGRKVIMCTTNGTLAIKKTAAAGARPIYLASLVNAPAVASKILAAGTPATLVCAGREGGFSLEDTLCAGLIVEEVTRRGEWRATDAARAAAALWRLFGPEIGAALAQSDHGRNLIELGFAHDLALAGEVGRYDLIPIWREGRVVRLEE